MENQSVRETLGVYREGDGECTTARFDEARQRAEADPGLAQWWAQEKELDRIIALKLQEAPVPAGLKARLLRPPEPVTAARSGWARGIALIAAAIVLLAVFFSSPHGLFQPAASLADYRDEMVSFVKVDPSLELKTSEVPLVNEFFQKTGVPSPLSLPAKLQQMKPVGCRTLRFHGNDVGLVCFKSAEGKLLHLFVINRAGLSKMPGDGKRAYSAEGEWVTVAWTDGHQAYLLTVQGDQAALDQYLPTS